MRTKARNLPISHDELLRLHECAYAECIKAFRGSAIANTDTEEFEATLGVLVKENFDVLQKENSRASDKACEAIFVK